MAWGPWAVVTRGEAELASSDIFPHWLRPLSEREKKKLAKPSHVEEKKSINEMTATSKYPKVHAIIKIAFVRKGKKKSPSANTSRSAVTTT